MRPQSLHYRADIDGLRALAVIPIVLFHLDFSLFNGGFVGVDVFFVISGFLITSIIHKEIQKNNFSFLLFYERRIRRIFPALFAVLAVTTLMAIFMLPPADFRSFSQSIAYTTIFGANILFWKTSGYFDDPAEMKPLLHTWSLSVEEQFYIIFPILLLAIIRYAPRHLRLLITSTALLSLLASVTVTNLDQEAAFYLPAYRAWELLLGALLALKVFSPPRTDALRNAISLAGLALIGYGILFLSDLSVFPSLNALYPCLGAALIIYAGSGGHHSLAGSILSWRPFVLIGLISYSLYLWHWPLIVFAKYYTAREFFIEEKLALLSGAIVMALLSWRFIERPFRGNSGLMSRKQIFSTSVAVMAAFIAIGLAGDRSEGFPQRMPPRVNEIANASNPSAQSQSKKCMKLSPAAIEHGEVCMLGNPDKDKPDFILWGDSHAAALAPAFDDMARKAGRSGWFMPKSSCPPLLGVERQDKKGSTCIANNEAITRFINKNSAVKTVFLVGRWGVYANSVGYPGEGRKPVQISPNGLDNNKEEFQRGLERTLQFLTNRNIKIFLVESIPEIGWNVPSYMARAALFGRETPLGPTLEQYRERQQPVIDVLEILSARYPLRIIAVSPLFCPDGRCLVEKDGMPLYRDDDHLSLHGAKFVSTLLTEAPQGQ